MKVNTRKITNEDEVRLCVIVVCKWHG